MCHFLLLVCTVTTSPSCTVTLQCTRLPVTFKKSFSLIWQLNKLYVFENFKSDELENKFFFTDVLYCCAWKAVRTSCPRDSMPAARTTPFRSSSVSPTCCARPPTGSRRSRECASPTSSPSTTSSNTKPVCLHCLLSAASEPARPRILPDAFPVMMVPAVSPSTKKFFFRFQWNLNLAEDFSRGSPEVTRTYSGIFCQPSVIFNLRFDCVVLKNIQ